MNIQLCSIVCKKKYLKYFKFSVFNKFERNYFYSTTSQLIFDMVFTW